MIPLASLRGGTTKQSQFRILLPNEIASFLAMTVFICIILITSCSPIRSGGQYDKVRKAPKHGLITPPGTVWLKDSLFMDKCEVSNDDYREYTGWLKRKCLNQNLPDTNTWNDAPMIKYYFRHPAYTDYPVVGVSYKQSIEFCKWKSDRVNENIHYKFHKEFRKRVFKYYDSIFIVPQYVKYRLPNMSEWEYAAQAGLDSFNYPYGYERLYDYNKPASITFEYYLLMKSPSHGDPIPSSNNFGRPNKYGIYNMLGNVSEMVNDSNVMGLNYKTLLTGWQVGSDTNYTPYTYHPLFTYYNYSNKYHIPNFVSTRFRYKYPTNYIGFRCICEVLKNP